MLLLSKHIGNTTQNDYCCTVGLSAFDQNIVKIIEVIAKITDSNFFKLTLLYTSVRFLLIFKL